MQATEWLKLQLELFLKEDEFFVLFFISILYTIIKNQKNFMHYAHFKIERHALEVDYLWGTYADMLVEE